MLVSTGLLKDDLTLKEKRTQDIKALSLEHMGAPTALIGNAQGGERKENSNQVSLLKRF